MRILTTFPGRSGDLIWALPSIRAISEAYGQPVDLLIAGEFVGMLDLLNTGALYLRHAAAKPTWSLTPPNEWDPQLLPEVTSQYDRVFHLGYRGWPECALPFAVHANLVQQWPDADGPVPGLPTLALDRPWLSVTGPGIPLDIAVGFTEAWFELKLGLLTSVEYLLDHQWTMQQLTPFHGRWTSEVPPATVCVYECDWLNAARAIRNSDLFLGDCSALHVLARALGKPVVLCEPMEGRWNDIFYPYGKSAHGVELLTGNDGLPSFDARHVADALRAALKEVR